MSILCYFSPKKINNVVQPYYFNLPKKSYFNLLNIENKYSRMFGRKKVAGDRWLYGTHRIFIAVCIAVKCLSTEKGHDNGGVRCQHPPFYFTPYLPFRFFFFFFFSFSLSIFFCKLRGSSVMLYFKFNLNTKKYKVLL